MKHHFNDLTDQKFGKLTALFPLDIKAPNGETLWQCVCECGGTKIVKSSHLTCGNTQSCGCIRNKKIKGQRFGRLVAISSRRRKRDNRVVWKCQCDCGRTTEIVTANLLNGLVSSCGCTGSIKSKFMIATGNKTRDTLDLAGKQLDYYTVLYDSGRRYFDYVIWTCKCNCGKIFYAPTVNITNGRIKSCGCLLEHNRNIFGDKVMKQNKYFFNKIGIGYTFKGEKFYFDKEDIEKIKNYCWRYNKYGSLIATWKELYPKKRVIPAWRVILNNYDMTRHITYKNGNKWDLRKDNLEVR